MTVPLPGPRTIERDGSTYAVGAEAPEGAIADPDDPRTITLVVDDHYSPSTSPECNTIAPRVIVARQNATSITLAAFAYRHPTRSGGYTCSYASTGLAPTGLNGGLPVRLDGPLGSRSLLDAATGEEIGILDPADYPRPTYIPGGYSQTLLIPFSQSEPVALRHYENGPDSLELRMLSASAWSRPDRVTAAASVGGLIGFITEDAYERCLAWTDQGLVHEVCSIAEHRDQLADSELVKIARSLR